MGNETTQFSIKMNTKNRLDRFKADNKEEIIDKYDKDKRYVTNNDVIEYLLDLAGARKKNRGIERTQVDVEA